MRASCIAPCDADARLGCTACVMRCWRPTRKCPKHARPARMRVPDPQPGRFSVASVSGSRGYATRRPRGRCRSPAEPCAGPGALACRVARPGPAGLGVGQGSKRTREGSLQQPFLRLSPLAPAASQSCVPSQAPPPGRPHSRSVCGGGCRQRVWCGQFRRHFGGVAKHGTVKGLASAEAPEALPSDIRTHAQPTRLSPAQPTRSGAASASAAGAGGGRAVGQPLRRGGRGWRRQRSRASG